MQEEKWFHYIKMGYSDSHNEVRPKVRLPSPREPYKSKVDTTLQRPNLGLERASVTANSTDEGGT